MHAIGADERVFWIVFLKFLIERRHGAMQIGDRGLEFRCDLADDVGTFSQAVVAAKMIVVVVVQARLIERRRSQQNESGGSFGGKPFEEFFHIGAIPFQRGSLLFQLLCGWISGINAQIDVVHSEHDGDRSRCF